MRHKLSLIAAIRSRLVIDKVWSIANVKNSIQIQIQWQINFRMFAGIVCNCTQNLLTTPKDQEKHLSHMFILEVAKQLKINFINSFNQIEIRTLLWCAKQNKTNFAICFFTVLRSHALLLLISNYTQALWNSEHFDWIAEQKRCGGDFNRVSTLSIKLKWMSIVGEGPENLFCFVIKIKTAFVNSKIRYAPKIITTTRCE